MCAKTSQARKHLCFLDTQIVGCRNMLACFGGVQSVWERNCEANASPLGRKRLSKIRKETEVAVVRVKITLACEECKQRNYNLTKEKKTHPDRMETKKYCKFCKAHTMHKETK